MRMSYLPLILLSTLLIVASGQKNNFLQQEKTSQPIQSQESINLVLQKPWLQVYQQQNLDSDDKAFSQYYNYEIKDYNCDQDARICNFNGSFIGEKNISNTEYSECLNITLLFLSLNEFNIQVADCENVLYRLPLTDPYPHDKDIQAQIQNNSFENTDDLQYYVTVYFFPFNFQIFRQSTDEMIFDTTIHPILLTSKFTTFGTTLPSIYLFGLGERFDFFRLAPFYNYKIWNRDRPANGTVQNNNTYGGQPVYLMREQSEQYHIMFFRSVNSMDINYTTYEEDGQQMQKILYGVIGGIIDLKFIFAGYSPEPAVLQYHNYLGSYQLQPYWSTGFHHCRWGYMNISQTRDIVKGYVDNNLPLDTFWLDIDYMDNKFLFTFDQENFPPEQINAIKTEYKKKFVPIVDPSVAARPYTLGSGQEYTIMTQGLEQDVFLKSTIWKDYPFLGKQWAGPVYYVDYSHPNASSYWESLFQGFKQQVNYDGIWLDMNEIGHFSYGYYNLTEENYDSLNNLGYPNEDDKLCKFEHENFPYLPGGNCPSSHTIAVEIEHYDKSLELNVHDLFSLHEVMATNSALKNVLQTPLPFILTRANVFGIGKYTAHWSGDDYSDFIQLEISISSIIRHNFYGVPFIGADICGFGGISTTVELCARWYQVGTLYPFSRNHNSYGKPSQAPFDLGPTMVIAARKALQLRYSILNYYYSLYMVNNFKGAIFKPLFFNYYYDNETIVNNSIVNKQFAIGNELIVIPVVYANTTQISGYFPKQNDWFCFISGKQVMSKTHPQRYQNIVNYIDDFVPIYQRGGTIVPVQNITGVQTSYDLNNVLYLKMALQQVSQHVFTAQGSFILLGNLENEQNVHDYCVQQNCLAMITITIQELETFTNVTLKVVPKNPSIINILSTQTTDVGVKLKGLQIAGNQNFLKIIDNSYPKLNALVTKYNNQNVIDINNVQANVNGNEVQCEAQGFQHITFGEYISLNYEQLDINFKLFKAQNYRNVI